jgi:hypothetical protein
MADIRMVIGQFARLIGNRFGNLLPTLTDVHAIKPCERVQKTGAVTIFDMHTRGGLDHAAGAFAARMLGKVGRGMEEIVPVPLVKLVIFQHLGIRSFWRWHNVVHNRLKFLDPVKNSAKYFSESHAQ